jgi:hypothetical protein
MNQSLSRPNKKPIKINALQIQRNPFTQSIKECQMSVPMCASVIPYRSNTDMQFKTHNHVLANALIKRLIKVSNRYCIQLICQEL